ncbi:MAG: hypothetical protein GEV11_23920 [Streptosporangiales bacterium]|nr:hypothetical protein [Streptosporangiales bacterium]
MAAAEQARAALEEIARLAETHAPTLNTAFHRLGEGALRGPAAIRLRSEMMRNHAQLRHAFTLALDHAERSAAAAEGPRVPRPVLAGTPVIDVMGRGGMVGGDPELLLTLAGELARAGRGLQDAGETVARLLLRLGLDAGPGRLIAEAGGWAARQRTDLLRRREALLREAVLGSDPSLGELLGYSLGGPAVTLGFEPDVADAQAQRLAALAARTDPPERRAQLVREFFAGLSRDERAALTLSHPHLIGNLDGAPHTLRYAANRLRIQHVLTQEQARLAILAPNDPDRALVQRRLTRFTEFLQPRKFQTGGVYASEERKFLLFDPSGDGRAAEVFGDLDTARHVAVSVPGVTNRLDNFNDFSDGVHDLYLHARIRGRTDTAGIAWLGYDTPGLIDGQLPETATRSAPLLHSFRAGLNLAENAKTTLISHSYGTRVSFEALRDGADFDNVVFMGSPGFHEEVRSVDDIGLPGDTGVYAMRAPGDYISYSANAGPDPASFPDITRLATGDGPISPRGHSQYYLRDSLSLANLSALAWSTGKPTTISTTPRQEARWATADQVFFERLLVHVPPEQMRSFVAKAGPLVRDLELGRVSLDCSDRCFLWILRLATETDILDYLTPAELCDALGSAVSAQTYWRLRDRGAPEPAARAGGLEAKAAAMVALEPLRSGLEVVRRAENTADAARVMAEVTATVQRGVVKAISGTLRDTRRFGGHAAESMAEDVRESADGLRGLTDGVTGEASLHRLLDKKEGRP